MIAVEPDSVRQILDKIASGETRYDCEFHIKTTWPRTVQHDGGDYSKTGKEGVRNSDGLPAAEYEANEGQRLWLGLDGRIEMD